MFYDKKYVYDIHQKMFNFKSQWFYRPKTKDSFKQKGQHVMLRPD